jgi:hypothetical protein
MSTRRRRIIASIPISAAIALGSLIGATGVFASGTCPGHQTEYVIPSETQTVDPLRAYDLNSDGIVCVAARGKKTVYSDNRP